ncbi:phage tail protein [Paracraurococcus lichenis]|uniref:Phage tail protein n=1 Tax=Paracraurococcus lichenis TaxID=3064888 RepID=A0ABT9EAN7_9PROT|nr:phage tail protein [Paracraurococcus sp. LOR1-02]MDO9713238.1 phage tail protein [Paracraurococcus sp. LOR1-02]
MQSMTCVEDGWLTPAVSIAAATLAGRAGVTTLDVASVAEPPQGFVVARQTTARAAFEEIMVGAVLTASAVPGGAQLRPRGTLPIAGIDVAALGAAEDERPPAEPWRAARAEESALPRVLELVFLDPARDYQSNTARSWRSTGAGQGSQTTELAMVLDASLAKARAEQAHRDLWAARTSLEGLTLPPRYGWIQAGEGLELLFGGAWRRLAVTSVAVGANGLVQLKAVVEQAGLWAPYTATADTGTLPANPAPTIIATTAHLLDIPLLRAEDDDAGFYAVLGGPAG